MQHSKLYPNIDMEKTGIHLKHLLDTAGYTVKEIQQYLHLSCPQPIYRWFKGKILPSVDHLLMLSELLDIHMEELLVKRPCYQLIYNMDTGFKNTENRLLVYFEKLAKKAS